MSRKNARPPGPFLLFVLRMFMLACVGFGVLGVRWVWAEWQWLQSPRLEEVSGVAKHFRHRTTRALEDRWTFSLSGHDKRIAFFGPFRAPPDNTRVQARVLLRADDNFLLGGIAPPPADLSYGLWLGDRVVVSPEAAMERARSVNTAFIWVTALYLLVTLAGTWVMFLIRPRSATG